jgi:hypothetical protein
MMQGCGSEAGAAITRKLTRLAFMTITVKAYFPDKLGADVNQGENVGRKALLEAAGKG